jgi:GNAT superfamily N-acetyltransferase
VACYVDPDVVRRGVGSAIMTHALAIARRGHDGPIRVEATLNAVPFYARFGFREVDRATLRRGAVDVPYVLMRRP